ncbi:MAG: DUF2155 domain-containing protein [Roseovarius sp.]
MSLAAMRGLAALAALGVASLAGSLAGAQEAVEPGTGAVLRGLDKVNASVTDMTLANGEIADFGRLIVQLRECRYPEGDPAGDAYAFLTIKDDVTGVLLFSGWMLASSPALNALEHPRYDVWVVSCTVPEGVSAPSSEETDSSSGTE